MRQNFQPITPQRFVQFLASKLHHIWWINYHLFTGQYCVISTKSNFDEWDGRAVMYWGYKRRKERARCYWMVYCSNNLLDMFRALTCPSSRVRRSGARTPDRRPPATKALHTICGNTTSIVSNSWGWAYKWPKHVEQIISAINRLVASSWFHLYTYATMHGQTYIKFSVGVWGCAKSLFAICKTIVIGLGTHISIS